MISVGRRAMWDANMLGDGRQAEDGRGKHGYHGSLLVLEKRVSFRSRVTRPTVLLGLLPYLLLSQ